MPRYEVQTYTLCDGWINCWSVDETPHTFATRQEAEKELREHLADIKQEILDCERELDEGYDEGEFQIVECAA